MSNTKKVFKSYSDPGHGWAAVKRKLLVELGIDKEITHFSFQRGQTVYLEEDCDLSLFVKAFTAKHGEAPQFVEGSYTNNQSPVRSYDRYRPS